MIRTPWISLAAMLLATPLLGQAPANSVEAPEKASSPQLVDARRAAPPCPESADTGTPCAEGNQPDTATADDRGDSSISPFPTERLQPAIDGSGLIQVGTNDPRRFGFSIGTLAGYDSAYLAKPGLDTSLYGTQVTAALALDSPRSHLLMQDGFTTLDFRKNGDTLTQLNRFSVDSLMSLSKRSTLHAAALDTYGNDFIRAVAPIQENVVGQTSAPNPDTSSFGLQGGTVQTTTAQADLTYQQSVRSGWVGSTVVSRMQWQGSPTQNTSLGKLTYLHLLSRDLTLGAYGQGSHQTGEVRCDTGGAGLGVTWSAPSHFSLNGSGGPVAATTSCGQRLAFLSSASAYFRMNDRIATYANFLRGPNTGYVKGGAWITSAGGGVKASVSNRVELATDYTVSFATSHNQLASYHEAYVGGTARFFFTSHLTQEISLRRFTSNQTNLAGERFIAQTTLWWTYQRNDLEHRLRHQR
jgi:hypothetical protein